MLCYIVCSKPSYADDQRWLLEETWRRLLRGVILNSWSLMEAYSCLSIHSTDIRLNYAIVNTAEQLLACRNADLLSLHTEYRWDTKFTVFFILSRFSRPGLHRSAWNLARGIANIPNRTRSLEILGAIPQGTAKLWPFFPFFGRRMEGYAFC